MRKGYLRALAAAVACLAATVGLAACGGGDDSQSQTSSADTGGQKELTKVSLAYAPVAQVEALWLANENGVFADHGIELDLTVTNNPAALPLALNSGQFDIIQTTWGAIAFSQIQGLSIVGIAPIDDTGTDETKDDSVLASLESSGIESLEDLEGKTVAVNTINNLASIQVESALEDAGVDPSSVKLVPITFPSQAAALKSGRVDAASMLEPFFTTLDLEEGLNVLAGVSIAVAQMAPMQGWAATEGYVEDNPEVVKGFQEAIVASNQYAIAHMDEMVDRLPEFNEGITPEIAGQMRMPRWVTTVNTAGLQELLDVQYEKGVMEEKVKAEDINRFSSSGSGVSSD